MHTQTHALTQTHTHTRAPSPWQTDSPTPGYESNAIRGEGEKVCVTTCKWPLIHPTCIPYRLIQSITLDSTGAGEVVADKKRKKGSERERERERQSKRRRSLSDPERERKYEPAKGGEGGVYKLPFTLISFFGAFGLFYYCIVLLYSLFMRALWSHVESLGVFILYSLYSFYCFVSLSLSKMQLHI